MRNDVLVYVNENGSVDTIVLRFVAWASWLPRGEIRYGFHASDLVHTLIGSKAEYDKLIDAVRQVQV